MLSCILIDRIYQIVTHLRMQTVTVAAVVRTSTRLSIHSLFYLHVIFSPDQQHVPASTETSKNFPCGRRQSMQNESDNCCVPICLRVAGFKSQRKAVGFACFIMALGVYFIIAGTFQERLTRANNLASR
jgi:hypothetical protein